jgi:hypothetical protein
MTAREPGTDGLERIREHSGQGTGLRMNRRYNQKGISSSGNAT